LRISMYAEAPHLKRLDEIKVGEITTLLKLTDTKASVTRDAFVENITDFYMTNPIARASATMAECSTLRAELENKKGTGTNG